MALHLPFHLAILGVAEGSVQLAQARYIYYSTEIMARQASYDCATQHLDGQALTSALITNVEYFKINESAQGTLALNYVWNEVYILGNTTGVCSPSNTTNTGNELLGLPMTFAQFFSRAIGAMFQAFDIDIPYEGEERGFTIALQSWVVVYTYFWSAILLLIVCYTITALLAGQVASSSKICQHLYSIEGRHDHPCRCFACCWRNFKSTLLLHSILHCERLDSSNGGFCVLDNLYKRSSGALVEKKEGQEREV
jgi:hypothetical protein